MGKFTIISLVSFLSIGFMDNGNDSGEYSGIEGRFKYLPVIQDTIQQKACLECHAELMQEETQHNPATKDCARCHTISEGATHPIEGAITTSLTNTMPDLCYECHDPKNEDEFVHAPAGEGQCLVCHSPHSSPNMYLVHSDPVSTLCLDCHDLHVPEGNMVHGAIEEGNCVACHNPHGGDDERFLPSNISRSCISCHREIRSQQRLDHVHAPFKRDCLNCHNGHNSKEAYLSDLQTKDLCLGCHEDMYNTIQNASLVHNPINDDRTCLNCHSPHASENKMMLLADSVSLCLDCHNKDIVGEFGTTKNIAGMLAEGNTIHGAIEEKGCAYCHESHASDRHTLLTGPFPEERYTPAKTENFDLCFQCHNKELFTKALTTLTTNFRNSALNLHNVHINGNKGRSCTLCHNVHGAGNAHLIDSKVKFGNWDMPVNYIQSENGGSCQPGCHEQRSYEREVALDTLGTGGIQKDTTIIEKDN